MEVAAEAGKFWVRQSTLHYKRGYSSGHGMSEGGGGVGV